MPVLLVNGKKLLRPSVGFNFCDPTHNSLVSDLKNHGDSIGFNPISTMFVKYLMESLFRPPNPLNPHGP